MGLWNDYVIASAKDTARRKQYRGESAAGEEFLIRTLSKLDIENRERKRTQAADEAHQRTMEAESDQRNREAERRKSDAVWESLEETSREWGELIEEERVAKAIDAHSEIIWSIHDELNPLICATPERDDRHEISRVVREQLIELRKAEQIVVNNQLHGSWYRRDRKEIMRDIRALVERFSLPRYDLIFPRCYGIADDFAHMKAAKAAIAEAAARSESAEGNIGAAIESRVREREGYVDFASLGSDVVISFSSDRGRAAGLYEERVVALRECVERARSIGVLSVGTSGNLVFPRALSDLMLELNPMCELKELLSAINFVNDEKSVELELSQIERARVEWKDRVTPIAQQWVADERQAQVKIFKQFNYDWGIVKVALDSRRLQFDDWQSQPIWPRVQRLTKRAEGGSYGWAALSFFIGAAAALNGLYLDVTGSQSEIELSSADSRILFGIAFGIGVPIFILWSHAARRNRAMRIAERQARDYARRGRITPK